ncbi:alpha/beta-hydrolase [Meira miltonrushii]|uniref:Prolyl endopeptidase n=1 Tax=Meira miltonrushii TaxID=1280837 RepID=A0A316VC02_9BASI|nr:alpha/beta-hydrolase [Meira miltonrushii]PWN35000.1 alpha/beta-hydrolase [Meira miltonrushii]
MYHTVGTDVKNDIVFLKPSTGDGQDLSYSFDVTIDRKVLVVYAFGDTGKPRLYATTLDQPLSEPRKWISISPDFELEFDYLTNVGNDYYFLARYDNESNQVIKYKLDFSKARHVNQLSDLKDKAELEPTVIPEDKNALIDIYTIFDYDKMMLCYTEDAQRKCFIYELQTGKRVQSILANQMGSSSSLASLTTGTEIFFWSWAYNTPGQLYYIKWNKDQGHATSELVHEAKLQSIDAKEFTVDLNWAVSKDSTKVPFYLFHRKGITFDGTRPVILNFYGAYRIIWLPYYSPTFMSWVRDYDAIFAFAYPRGGGEVKAEQWHLAGTKANKQKTIDDINAVIEYLINNKIAAKGKLIIYGQFAGSTSAMALVNQAQEGNIGVVTLQNGMFDFLRFPDSPANLISKLDEYGDPRKPEDFDWLRKLSPLHNVDQKKEYPAILFLPGDDVDSQWHGRKMVATLQHDLANNPNPFFYSTYDSKLSDEENLNNDPVYSIAFAAYVLGLQRVTH